MACDSGLALEFWQVGGPPTMGRAPQGWADSPIGKKQKDSPIGKKRRLANWQSLDQRPFILLIMNYSVENKFEKVLSLKFSFGSPECLIRGSVTILTDAVTT